jgi:hypothetical protein
MQMPIHSRYVLPVPAPHDLYEIVCRTADQLHAPAACKVNTFVRRKHDAVSVHISLGGVLPNLIPKLIEAHVIPLPKQKKRANAT